MVCTLNFERLKAERLKKLLEEDVTLVKQKHPSWSLYDLPWDIKKEKEEDSDKENK